MDFQTRTKLAGSEKQPLAGSQLVSPVNPNETVRVSVLLRRNGNEPSFTNHTEGTVPLSHQELEQRYGADPADIDLVEKFAHEFQLTVAESSAPKRRVVLVGTAEAMSKAFGAELAYFKMPHADHNFRGRQGALTIPEELNGVVMAVLGLDDRPAAKPHFRINKEVASTRAAAPAATTSFTPPQVAALYNFPTGVNGKGQSIAIIELGGGYIAADLKTYFSGLGIPTPKITAVSVDGGKNAPGSDADGEVMLDIEVVGSIAPGGNIVVYFAPNTDKGFVDAITQAAHDTKNKPSVISISWGAPEDSWTQQARDAINAALQDAAALGVTVTVASGDDGSTDGVGDHKLHVDFPSASPYSLACGGTTLKGSGKTISSEVVWNEVAINEGATGGGVSRVLALPSYQSSAGVPKHPETGFVGRGVPDVAGDADPATGYQIRVNGKNVVIGGTSAVAPLWAALVALINQKVGKRIGFLNPTLYAQKETGFHDITVGTNDDAKLGNYKAQVGWDACTGLGTPDGMAVSKYFASGAPSTSSEDVLTPALETLI